MKANAANPFCSLLLDEKKEISKRRKNRAGSTKYEGNDEEESRVKRKWLIVGVGRAVTCKGINLISREFTSWKKKILKIGPF